MTAIRQNLQYTRQKSQRYFNLMTYALSTIDFLIARTKAGILTGHKAVITALSLKAFSYIGNMLEKPYIIY